MISAAHKTALTQARVSLQSPGTASWSLSCGAAAMFAMGSGLVSSARPAIAVSQPPDIG
jgi:hypothetical protein